MINCPCNSQKSYASCCQPFITGQLIPPTPEALMRSRYTAFTLANTDYLQQTMRGAALAGFQAEETKRWAKKVRWIKLEVLTTSMANEELGFVAFEAYFVEKESLKTIHENSEFRREEGRWYYVTGTHLPTTPKEQTLSRNANCPCGSLRKYKNCHGS